MLKLELGCNAVKAIAHKNKDEMSINVDWVFVSPSFRNAVFAGSINRNWNNAILSKSGISPDIFYTSLSAL